MHFPSGSSFQKIILLHSRPPSNLNTPTESLGLAFRVQSFRLLKSLGVEFRVSDLGSGAYGF